MKSVFIKTFVATLLALYVTGAAFAQQQILSQTGPYFGIGIEQNGRAVALEDHAVTLEKNSFTIVLTFPGQEGILINASATPETFDAARTEKPFAELSGFRDLGMAEEAFNPRALLMLSPRAPHFWYYAHEGEHRFNEVIRQERTVICRRIVANLMYRDISKEITSIRDMPGDHLYLVFVKTEWSNDYAQQYEKQRDYLKITFK